MAMRLRFTSRAVNTATLTLSVSLLIFMFFINLTQALNAAVLYYHNGKLNHPTANLLDKNRFK